MAKVKTVVTVLRSGGEYGPEHVQAMQRQVRRWAPASVEFRCLSDVPVPGVQCLPLYHGFPSWWSKMELFAIGVDDFLYTDLDNIFVGPMDDLLEPHPFMLQRGGWTALMYIPWDPNRAMWNRFMQNPGRAMAAKTHPHGDAGFISSQLPFKAWEDELPGQVVNIVELMGPPICGRASPRLHHLGANARVILCGGTERRPWKLPGFKNWYWCQEAI